MILASFDLSFFTSVPGLLITGGVLLLLIALIIFIATGTKKGKKDKKNSPVESSEVASTAAPSIDSPITANTTAQVDPLTVNPSINTMNTMDNNQVNMGVPNNIGVETPKEDVVPPVTIVERPKEDEFTNLTEPTVTPTPTVPVTPEMTQATAQPAEVPPVMPTVSVTEEVNNTSVEPVSPVTPVIDNVNTNVNGNVEAIPNVVNTITPEPVSQVMPTVTENVPNSIPSVEPTVINTEPVSTVSQIAPTENIEQPKQDAAPIYGGVSPVIPNIEVTSEHRPIYGGANPLENTQSIKPVTNESITNTPEVTPNEVIPNISENQNTTPTPNVIPTIDSNINNINSEPKQEEKEVAESLF